MSEIKDDLKKYIFLRDLFNTSKDIFFGFLQLHMREFIPIIYTPTVGYVIKNYSQLVDRPLGVIITYSTPPANLLDEDEVISFHQGYIERQLAKNLPPDTNKRILIVTDANAILGIGDQGFGGIEICFGKGKINTLCGGINPHHILHVLLDLGTDN